GVSDVSDVALEVEGHVRSPHVPDPLIEITESPHVEQPLAGEAVSLEAEQFTENRLHVGNSRVRRVEAAGFDDLEVQGDGGCGGAVELGERRLDPPEDFRSLSHGDGANVPWRRPDGRALGKDVGLEQRHRGLGGQGFQGERARLQAVAGAGSAGGGEDRDRERSRAHERTVADHDRLPQKNHTTVIFGFDVLKIAALLPAGTVSTGSAACSAKRAIGNGSGAAGSSRRRRSASAAAAASGTAAARPLRPRRRLPRGDGAFRWSLAPAITSS